jgi:hypothetical protein
MISGYIQTSIIYDTDAQAFFTAAGITDVGQKNAVNDLVLSLKADSLWTKLTAIYPFVGGSASSHAVNLKSPGTYDLTFYGGITHDSNGITGNGTTGYADTGLKPTNLGLDSAHISAYIRTNTNANIIDVGSTNASGSQDDFQIIPRWSDGVNYSILNAKGVAGFSQARSDAFNLITRTSSTGFNYFRNTSKTAVTKTSDTRNNFNIYIAARNNANTAEWYSNRNISFVSIGDGMNDTDAANFNTHITTYQTALSRNV